MRYTVHHTTQYKYLQKANYSIQALRLWPAEFDGQKLISWDIKIENADLTRLSHDGFGNLIYLATLSEPHQEIRVEAHGEVEVEDRTGVVAGLNEAARPRVFLRETPQSFADEAIKSFARSHKQADTLERLHSLSENLAMKISFTVGATKAATTAGEVFELGEGVCQDFSHVFIAAARSLNIPARYVTGYLFTGDDKSFEAHHAWAEAWVENLGWVGFDVANGVCTTDKYVRLASGLDARSAAPIRGSQQGGAIEDLDVQVYVQQQQVQS